MEENTKSSKIKKKNLISNMKLKCNKLINATRAESKNGGQK